MGETNVFLIRWLQKSRVHFKIVHDIYPTNTYIGRFTDVNKKCEFCKMKDETVKHLFYGCQETCDFWGGKYRTI